MDSESFVTEVADKVRAIVSEAEQKAAQIIDDAERQANEIRDRAESEGRERLAEVRDALDDLQGKLGTSNGARSEVNPGPVVVPEPQPPSPGPTPDPVPEPTPEPPSEPTPPVIPEPTPPPDEGTPPSIAAGGKSDDATSARLVAMNMALDGASREAIEAHLAEHYAIDDSGVIVDDVLALAAN